MDVARRGFLRGRFRSVTAESRPPWALAEAAFLDRCSRCDACVTACPTGVVRVGDGGYPTIDFSRGECTFCGDCVTACETGALRREADAPAWTMKARLGDACVARKGVECRICGENCEAGAIRFRPALGGISRPEMNEGICTGCGACVAPCPVGAIAVSNPMEGQQ
ncbi:ferredoxin-type protein NapF [Denitromonas iodatirespirans]|uniref:Ferredoxin-type protein NapF n=1 Tax=Denitromonas iodatirespirans TaxID=2795389 RepID=A0A944DHR4_DENI1|nr:ferredoxin-type protein NapF [Denitromonas iodatirespirans]MBT0963093.1 ferredoxin-type protein NapF [Denitromonas iodatirespirans]